MRYILRETAKYLLMVLALIMIGFIVLLVGLFVLAFSPILPLFQKDKMIELWSFKDVWSIR